MDHFEFDPERTVLGTVFTHAGEEEFALGAADRLNHLLVIGKTGMGKTTLLKNIAIQDIHTGRGVAVIDPHGDLSHDLLKQIPSSRARDLVWIDPSDPDRVVTFNPLRNVPRDKIAAATANIVSTFAAIWRTIGWGARMERILYAATAALIEAPNTSLVGLPRLLKDADYRAEILAHVDDPIIRSFFDEEYAVWDDDYRMQAIDPVLNKAEALLHSPAVRAMLGSTTSSIDFSEIMDEHKILLANLSKGALGEGHAHLIGAMLVSGFSHAAMARGAVTPALLPPQDRVPFYLIVDEFQNFSTDSFGDIASEARKWKLGLVLGHQFLEQLPERLRASVLGNAGTIIAFQLSGADSATIARELALNNPDMLTQLSKHQVWAKHATYGGPYHPRLLPPIVTDADGREAALNENIRRHTFPRTHVEGKIRRFLRNVGTARGHKARKQRARRPSNG
jgi:uncharacterized protein DUF87